MGVTHCRSIRALFFWLAATMLAFNPALLSAHDAPAPYVSVWAQLNPDVPEITSSPGSLLGEFRAAAKARNDQEAVNSWQRFISEFDPQDGYFEDGMHARLVEWAKMELVRLHHRATGDVEAERAQIAVMRNKVEQ